MVGGLGLGIVFVAIVNFLRELRVLESLLPPVVAAALGIIPGVALLLVAVWLARSDVRPRHRWLVGVGAVTGFLLFGTVMVTSIAVRVAEGRTVSEPRLPITIAAASGAVAGTLVGITVARVRQSAKAAETARENLAFVNSVLRHDVLNGLSVISSRVELAADDCDDELVRSITEQTEQLQGLIERTQAMIRAMDGTDSSPRETVDLSGLVAESVDRLDSTYESATVEADVDPDLVVRANQILADVIWNVLTNAVEHSDRSEPTVAVTAVQAGDVVRVTITDDGPGIPEAQRARLFDRTVAADESTGGFGLFFVGTMIDAWDSEVRVEDREPRGTRFVMEFPAAAESADAVA